MQDIHEIQDFYAVAHLLQSGFTILDNYREHNLTTFVFERSDALLECIQDYYNHNAISDVLEYAKAIRNLKAIIHTNRVSSTTSARKVNNEFYNKQEGTI